VIAVLLLTWSVPSFIDPPILGNGVSSGARQIEAAAAPTPDGRRLAGHAQHYRWLFHRYNDSLLIIMGTALVLLATSFVTLQVALQLHAAVEPRMRAGKP
jgi:hypothetical protein